MKKLLVIGFLMAITLQGFGQELNPKGLYAGRKRIPVSGSNIGLIDSITYNSTTKTFYFYHGADTASIYTPVANQIDGSTLYAPKYILDTLLLTASDTLELVDAGRTITAASASQVLLTVRADASIDFPVGTVINVKMGGAGIVTFVPEAGVIFEAQKDSTSINTKWGWATLVKRAANKWSLFGAILD